MTQKEINVAIAEVCGWKWKPKGDSYGPLVHPWLKPNGERHPGLDYYHDLNAMHEVERAKILPAYRDDYTSWLSRVVERERRMASTQWLRINATAAQRAEAFLRTFKKWKE